MSTFSLSDHGLSFEAGLDSVVLEVDDRGERHGGDESAGQYAADASTRIGDEYPDQAGSESDHRSAREREQGRDEDHADEHEARVLDGLRVPVSART